MIVYTPPPLNQKAPEIQDALTVRGALIAAGLLDDSSKITLLPRSLIGETHSVEVFVGPRAAEQ